MTDNQMDEFTDPQQNQTPVHFSAAIWQGTLPPPEILDGYNTAITSGAERVVAIVENEAKHRHSLETYEAETDRTEILAKSGQMKRGQWMTFILTLVAVLSGSGLVLAGYPWPGGFFGATGVLVIAASLVRTHK